MDPLYFSFFASLGAALCLTLTIIFDRYIVNDYYDGNIRHAWLVSSLWGGALGFVATIIILSVFILLTSTTVSELLDVLTTIDPLLMLGMAFAGFLASHMLKHYFALFTDTTDSALIAAWLSSSPILILGVYILFSFIFPSFFSHHTFNADWIIGVITASIGLILFQLTSRDGEGGGSVYYKSIFSFILYSIAYTIIIHEILTYSESLAASLLTPLVLLFFYWIGFGTAGVIRFLHTPDRQNFLVAWKNKIHLFWAQILLIEIINMFVFYFEYLGLVKLDPAVVSVIIGTCIFFTYIVDLALAKVRSVLERSGSVKIKLLSFTLRAELLPTLSLEAKHIVVRFAIIIITIVGIYIAAQ